MTDKTPEKRKVVLTAPCVRWARLVALGPKRTFVLFPANGCFSPDADRSRAPRPAGGVELKVDYSLVRLMEPQPRDFLCPNPLQP